MANRLSIDCPIDGTSLATNRAPTKVSVAPSANIGEHVHVEYDLDLTCSNGHVWHLKVDGELTRTA